MPQIGVEGAPLDAWRSGFSSTVSQSDRENDPAKGNTAVPDSRASDALDLLTHLPSNPHRERLKPKQGSSMELMFVSPVGHMDIESRCGLQTISDVAVVSDTHPPVNCTVPLVLASQIQIVGGARADTSGFDDARTADISSIRISDTALDEAAQSVFDSPRRSRSLDFVSLYQADDQDHTAKPEMRLAANSPKSAEASLYTDIFDPVFSIDFSQVLSERTKTARLDANDESDLDSLNALERRNIDSSGSSELMSTDASSVSSQGGFLDDAQRGLLANSTTSANSALGQPELINGEATNSVISLSEREANRKLGSPSASPYSSMTSVVVIVSFFFFAVFLLFALSNPASDPQ